MLVDHCVGGLCDFLGSVSLQQKFEVTDGPELQLSYSSVLFGKQRKNTSSRHEGGPTKKKEREEIGSIFGSSLYIYFFFLPPSLPYVYLASQEGCLFHLRFSVRFLDLLLFYFHGLFPFFVI